MLSVTLSLYIARRFRAHQEALKAAARAKGTDIVSIESSGGGVNQQQQQVSGRFDPQLRTTVVKKTAADILKDTEGRFFAQLAAIREE